MDTFYFLVEEMRHWDDKIRHKGGGNQNIGTCDKKGKSRGKNEPVSPEFGTPVGSVLNFWRGNQAGTELRL